ncbi:MAG: DUF456 domain-containing protein [Gemmatimonadota bacterium]
MSAELVLQGLSIVVMTAALLTVPLGLPGVWIMMAVLFVGALAGWVSWPVLLVLLAIAGGVELLEFLALKKMGERYGGSRGAFWGAVAGGLLGALVGAPIPVMGPLLAGMVGTFAGAGAVTWWTTRSTLEASRVGWGMLLARVLAVGLKVAAGIAVLLVGGGALLLR